MISFLRYDAMERMSAREAMKHAYFKDAREAEAKKTALEQAHNAPSDAQHQPSADHDIVVAKKVNPAPKVQQQKALPSLVVHETLETDKQIQIKQVIISSDRFSGLNRLTPHQLFTNNIHLQFLKTQHIPNLPRMYPLSPQSLLSQPIQQGG